MKKLTFLLVFMLAFAGLSRSQIVEDFEHIKLNWFAAGAEGYMRVVPNPDIDDVNPSSHVVEFRRGADGDPWAGFWSRLPEPLDLTEHKYVYVDVWKPVNSPVVFKLEPDDADNFETPSMFPQTKVEEWETLVFDFSGQDGLVEVIAFFPDFPEQVEHEEDIMIYFDNIRVGGPPDSKNTDKDIAYYVEDFEHISLNVMRGGEEDDSYMVVVPNPDMESGNDSEHVVMFKRSQHGVPWGGFWSALPGPIDLTDHKYIMVDVWKPRISPLKFKVEGGDTDNLEIESMAPQTKVGEWETIVFDFSEKTGEWAVIAFMPDFADPLDLDEDIVIYFDNIRLGEAPLSAPDVSADHLGMKVYPNPASGFVIVETDPGARVNLVSINGGIIDSKIAEGNGVTFNVAGLPVGVYLIRVISRGNTASEKLIVY